MNIYVDFDDCLCETARHFSVLAAEMFGLNVPYEKIKYFNLQQSFSLSDEDYDKNEDRYGYSSLYYTSESRANEWVEKGYSKWISNPDNKDLKLVTGPDWHSPNWCTTQEMEKAVNETFYDKDQGWHGDYEEWVALVGAMKGYEISGEYEVRAVFWFDN